jgi:hypothetical protein
MMEAGVLLVVLLKSVALAVVAVEALLPALVLGATDNT